jgi:collagenase-like PrtC family protease
MQFELPYTAGIKKYIDSLDNDSRSSISDIYFSDERLSSSARYIWYDSEAGEDSKWNELLALKKMYGIDLHYVITPSVWRNDSYNEKGLSRIKSILDKVWNKGCTWLTVNNPLLLRMEKFRDDIPPFKIKLSINNHISTLEEVQFAYRTAGLRHFVLDRKINRNFDELKRISDWLKTVDNTSITLLAQESCIPDCQWKNVCDNLLSTYHQTSMHEVNDLQNIHNANLCGNYYEDEAPQDIFKSPFILPTALCYYAEYVDYIKLAGRERDITEFSKTIDCYLKGSDNMTIHTILPKATSRLTGTNLVELTDHGCAVKWLNCKSKCAECNFCDKLYSNIIDERRN